MKRLTKREALGLLKRADLLELGSMADDMRKTLHPSGVVTFVVDRNINYTNVCVNRCTFCAFWRDEEDPEGYVLGERELARKIEETLSLGGTQILLQGGLHPALDISYYLDLLRGIKKRFDINVHGFSPPEICFIADGAPRKIDSARWLRVMEEAHVLGMRTTATMMFGSIESPEDIVEHLDAVRGLQDRTGGFTAFIPWSFQPGNTRLAGKVLPATAVEYLRVLALSRVYLDNVPNIQASWVTQGVKTAQVALRFGANDFGSTMIEENVVAAAGVTHRVSMNDMMAAVKAAGFRPAERDTVYNILRMY
jgi:cyclic dehypoxanthinyl futalosine synthase